MVAYYGLTVLRVALLPELEDRFSVTGKILSLQLTLLLSSAIPNLIIGIFVSTNVIHCGDLFPSKARGEGWLLKPRMLIKFYLYLIIFMLISYVFLYT